MEAKFAATHNDAASPNRTTSPVQHKDILLYKESDKDCAALKEGTTEERECYPLKCDDLCMYGKQNAGSASDAEKKDLAKLEESIVHEQRVAEPHRESRLRSQRAIESGARSRRHHDPALRLTRECRNIHSVERNEWMVG